MMPDKVERLCQRAQQAIAGRDWDTAKQAYLLALGLRSDLPDVHYGLATVFFQVRELASAAHHFREVTRLDPRRAGAFVNLGAILNLLGQYDDALTALRRAIQLDSQRVEAYYNLGLVYRHKGQVDLGIQAYKEALRLNPRMPDAHLNLANLYLDKEQLRQAIHHYEQALQLRPNWDKALDGLEEAQAKASGEQRPRTPFEIGPVRSAGLGGTAEPPLDPVIHAAFLTNLHQAAIVSEETARLLQRILGEEVEPVIKELSSVLLHAAGPRSELDVCVGKFEHALQRMRTAQQALKGSVNRINELSEHPPATGAPAPS
jgi:tetratricopeptide (TPR) repeat protein